MKLHAVPSDVEQRVLVIARTYASNLLDHITRSLTQAETGKPLTGPVGRPDDRVPFLVRHDTNIATLAGVLGLHWVIDGRQDDMPLGDALTFELWRSTAGDTDGALISAPSTTMLTPPEDKEPGSGKGVRAPMKSGLKTATYQSSSALQAMVSMLVVGSVYKDRLESTLTA